MRLKKAVANLMGLERVCRVATAGGRGPHVVPVCQVVDEGRIYFGSDRDAAKVRHLQRDPRIAVVVDL